MIIIETCPKCGHDLFNTVVAANPPIPRRECPACGWFWEGEPEQVLRVPFGGNQLINKGYTLDWLHHETSSMPSACVGCSNHPSNGGSGVCHCTLGGSPIY